MTVEITVMSGTVLMQSAVRRSLTVLPVNVNTVPNKRRYWETGVKGVMLYNQEIHIRDLKIRGGIWGGGQQMGGIGGRWSTEGRYWGEAILGRGGQQRGRLYLKTHSGNGPWDLM